MLHRDKSNLIVSYYMHNNLVQLACALHGRAASGVASEKGERSSLEHMRAVQLVQC